jgi:hypothetical protein
MAGQGSEDSERAIIIGAVWGTQPERQLDGSAIVVIIVPAVIAASPAAAGPMATVPAAKGVSMSATEMAATKVAAAEMAHGMTTAIVPDERGVGRGGK